MIRVTEDSLAIKILHERDLMVYEECPQILFERFFFCFVIVIVNFRLYALFTGAVSGPWSASYLCFFLRFFQNM